MIASERSQGIAPSQVAGLTGPGHDLETTSMSINAPFDRTRPTSSHVALARTIAVLLTSVACLAIMGCAQRGTLRTTVGNDTQEIDRLTELADNPQPEVHPSVWATAPVTAKTLREDKPIEYRDLGLNEVLTIAMENSEVLRDLGGTLLRTPDIVRTRYATGLQQTDPRFGTAAALSAFDAQLRASANFNRNDRIYNNSFFAGGLNSSLQDYHEYKTELSKKSAIGSTMTLRGISDSDQNNAPGNVFPGAWNSYIETEVRQPIFQGAGLQYNRIAGPTATVGQYNGILIARVNTDINQTDFEMALRDYVSNVVNTYWDLYYSYRELDARRRAMNGSLESWRKIKAQVETEGVSASREAQAREQYYRFKSEVDDSLTGRLLQGTQTRNGSTGGTLRANGGVQVCERRLRLMIGLPISDGQLLRPNEDPNEAEVVYDWDAVMTEALTRRPELRRQQLKVRRREMELLASQNFILPTVDAVGRYRVRGFGDQLIAKGDQSGGKPISSIGNMATLDHQEWMVGVEMAMPIGFRQGHAAVANAELALCHERAIQREQERDVVHDLSNALADAVRAYESCQNNLNRYIASKEVLSSLEAEEQAGLPVDVDRLLDTQRRVTEAEIRYFQSRAEYAVAIKNVQFEKGSLNDENDLIVIDAVAPPEPEARSNHGAHASASSKMKFENKRPIASRVKQAVLPASANSKPRLQIDDESMNGDITNEAIGEEENNEGFPPN